MTDTLEAALAYAGRGWCVFPVPPGTKAGYNRDKPRARPDNGRPWGNTRDPAEIEQDWRLWPFANVGIAMGAESNLWALDVDTKAGHGVDGFATLAALEATHGPLPPALMSESPSGSRHYYWRYTAVIANPKLGEGLDVRGQGGMVVAPPSRRGKERYRWLNDLPVADAPMWLIELARSKSLSKNRDNDAPAHIADANQGRGVSTDPDDQFAPLTREEVKAALDMLDPDCDYDTWMRIAAATCKGYPDLFVEWSSRGSKYPGKQACQDKATEFAAMTAITVATLFHLATEANPDWRDYIGL